MREGVVATVTYVADAKALPVWRERPEGALQRCWESGALRGCCDRCAPYPDRECHDSDGRGHLFLGAGCALYRLYQRAALCPHSDLYDRLARDIRDLSW